MCGCSEKSIVPKTVERNVTKHITPHTNLYSSLSDNPWGQASRPDYLEEAFLMLSEIISEGVFLDLGCGIGNVLEQASTYFPDMKMWGIEWDRKYAEEARKRGDSIYHDNLLHRQDLIDKASIIYSFEPTYNPEMHRLFRMIEKSDNCKYYIHNYSGCRYDGEWETIFEMPDKDPLVDIKQNIVILKRL